MRCPYCQIDNDRVIDSRASEDGMAIRRRRECLGCHRRYTTFERVEEVSIKVIKKDGNRVPFDRTKIKSGLEKACWKRPISDDQIEAAVSAVEREIYDRFDSEVETRDIGELVMQQLAKLDQVAYVRFASVYREFKDARDFVEELQPILDEEKRATRFISKEARGGRQAANIEE
jgi:transcriptional repressor NrdR